MLLPAPLPTVPLTSLPFSSTPQLWIDPIDTPQICLGAFQRAASAVVPQPLPLSRRLSGGPALWLAPPALHLLLTLPSPSALVPDADPHRLLNRHVRPLLRALSLLRAPAHYGGRDWVSVQRHPAVWIGFAHDASSGACAFEAFLPLDQPFALLPPLAPARSLDPFLQKTPLGLRAAAGRDLSLDELSDALARAYDQLAPAPLPRASWPSALVRPLVTDPRPPWDALREEPIGWLGASASPLCLGGDLFASEDLLARLDTALALLGPDPSPAALEHALTEAVASGGVIAGVRSADALVGVLRDAIEAHAARR